MGTYTTMCLTLLACSVMALIPPSGGALSVWKDPSEGPGLVGRGPALTVEEAERIIDTLFAGYLRARDCAQHPGRQGYALAPFHVTADFNHDGFLDVAVAAWVCVDTTAKPHVPLPFRLVDVGRRSPVPHKSHESREFRDLLIFETVLVILHGQPGQPFQETPPGQRFAIARAIGGGDKELIVFRGRLKPAKVGDQPKPIAPPQGVVTAVVPNWRGEGMAVYWNGINYSDYPWYSCLYPKPKAASRRRD